MSIKKYTDWRTWWDGLRTTWLKCLGTTGSAWLATNGLAASVPALKSMAVDWKAGLGFFAVHLAKEFFDYVKDNQPKVIVEETNTEFKTLSATGVVTEGSQSTKTTTPIQNNENNPPQS